MSSTIDKAEGYANEAAGAVKQSVGKTLGDDRMQAEGAARKAAGKAQVGVAKAKEAVKSVVDKT